METKICSTCKKELPISSFSTRGDKYQSNCKSCHSSYRKKHYEDNKQKYIDKANKYRVDGSEWLREYKKDLKCIICNESRSWVLDFHHLESNSKEFNISELTRRSSREKVLKEIDKCTILCSNCHRDLHYHENNKSSNSS